MIELVVVTFAAVAASVWILSALRAKDGDTTRPTNLSALDRKQRALEALLDLEDDVATGKISGVGGQILRAEHEHEAARALRELESSEDETDIETAIARARNDLRGA